MGAFVLSAVVGLVSRERCRRLVTVGAVLSPLSVMAGLAFLLSELGYPLRLPYTLVHFNPTSPLSWGGPLQGGFILVGLWYGWLCLRGGSEGARRTLAAAGLFLALAVGGYHGVLLAVLTARPLWNSAFAVAAALSGFAVTGMAAVLLGVFLFPGRRGEPAGPAGDADAATGTPRTQLPAWYAPALFAGLVLHGLLLWGWWLDLSAGGRAARRALETASAVEGALFWSWVVVLGLVLPGLLLLAAAARGKARRGTLARALALAAALLILAGGFAFRYVVVIGEQLS